jgi:hypothetical protein
MICKSRYSNIYNFYRNRGIAGEIIIKKEDFNVKFTPPNKCLVTIKDW